MHNSTGICISAACNDSKLSRKALWLNIWEPVTAGAIACHFHWLLHPCECLSMMSHSWKMLSLPILHFYGVLFALSFSPLFIVLSILQSHLVPCPELMSVYNILALWIHLTRLIDWTSVSCSFGRDRWMRRWADKEGFFPFFPNLISNSVLREKNNNKSLWCELRMTTWCVKFDPVYHLCVRLGHRRIETTQLAASASLPWTIFWLKCCQVETHLISWLVWHQLYFIIWIEQDMGQYSWLFYFTLHCFALQYY